MSTCPWSCALTLGVALVASPAFAQRRAPEPPQTDDWRHGTTLTASVGAAADGSDTSPAVGGAIGWELTPRLTIEGGGLWLDRSYGSDGFNAVLKMRAGLRRGNVMPFIEGGVGLFRVSVDGAQSMPAFYRRRLTGTSPQRRPFTDPTFQVGGGVSVFTSRHISLQPVVEAIVVTRDSHVYTLTSLAIRASYHFEEHPVTR